MSFWVVSEPSDRDLTELQATDPTNPFAGAAYVRARRSMGARPVLFAEGQDGLIDTGAVGYLQGRSIFPWIEIPSSPAPPHAAIFWDGVRKYCRQKRVVYAEIESYGARSVSLPNWSEARDIRPRIEWRLLLSSGAADSFGSGHKRSINKARKSGVTITPIDDPAAADSHARLIGASMRRRAERGESVAVVSSRDADMVKAFLAAGAGRLYQATYRGEIASSILVLLAPSGAYYHSAGTTPEGMEIGASTYLVSEIISLLRDKGLSLFNLSGAGSDNPGLQRFKRSFGAEPVELQAGVYQLAPPIVRKLRTGVRLLRNPALLRRALLAIDKFVVFAAAPEDVPRRSLADSDLVKLDEKALHELATAEPEYSEQTERVSRLGYNSAYGLRVGGEVRHVGWLIDHDLDARTIVRNVKLKAGEVEITHCLTPSKYRGQSLYPIAISALCALAGERGARRVFMIVNVQNTASQRGIEKAGLTRIAHIWRIALLDRDAITIRGHRWTSADR
jgi:hypothetical protein